MAVAGRRWGLWVVLIAGLLACSRSDATVHVHSSCSQLLVPYPHWMIEDERIQHALHDGMLKSFVFAACAAERELRETFARVGAGERILEGLSPAEQHALVYELFRSIEIRQTHARSIESERTMLLDAIMKSVLEELPDPTQANPVLKMEVVGNLCRYSDSEVALQRAFVSEVINGTWERVEAFSARRWKPPSHWPLMWQQWAAEKKACRQGPV